MKKIIISLSIIAIVAVVSIGITTAYFTDTEKSEDNTMAAGTMDLNIDGGNTAVQTMSLSNKAPSDSGIETAILKNVGSLDGELDIAMGIVNNSDCYSLTPFANLTEYCDSTGTLGANAKMALYVDVDKSGTCNSGDIGLKSNGTIYTSGVLDYDAIDNYSGQTWDPSNNGVVAMATGVDYNFVIAWEIPTTVGNGIQGDALDFDVSFTLEQVDAD